MKSTRFEVPCSIRLPKDVQWKRTQRVIQEELTELQRYTLLAYYTENKNMAQIARERGVNISTVCRTLQRAEKRLQRFLQY